MEDAHTALLSFNNDKNSAFFAVYDGHFGKNSNFDLKLLNNRKEILKIRKKGPKAANYAGMHLHEKIPNQPNYGKIFAFLKLFKLSL